MKYYDIVIIGAGAIGSAAARMFSRFNSSILVLERESDVGEITSAANSAIVHSGYDPVPGSLKAEMNVLGNRLFPSMCEELDIELKNIHLPKGEGSLEEVAAEYEAMLVQNPLDIQLLGVGSNGHIGFNEPGTSFDSTVHVVRLKEETRQDNARFFKSIDEVPNFAITMGEKW